MVRFSNFSKFINRLKNKGYREDYLPGFFDNPETRYLRYAWNFTKGNVLVMVYSDYALIKYLR